MRRLLDGIYEAGLISACAAMAAIAVLVLAQVLGRITDRVAQVLGLEPLGLSIPSLAEIGAFLFVGAACLALPSTLRAGGHVRVTLLQGSSGPRLRRFLNSTVLLASLGLCGFAAWHSGAQAYDSLAFNTVSYGMVRIPLWIPQGAMTLGFGLLALALADEVAALVRGGEPALETVEQSRQGEEP